MKTIVNSDAYNLASDLAVQADSANVFIPVANQTERDGLAALMGGTLLVPTMVYRADLNAYESWNGSTWDRVVVATAGAGVTDGFWTITGGLVKTVTAGLTQVTASLLLVRSGAGIGVSVSGNTLIVGLLPSGYRPPGNFSLVGSVTDGSDARYAEPELIVNNGGSLVGRSTSGGSITISTGYKLYISGTWFL
jgi:hypothetical protein